MFSHCISSFSWGSFSAKMIREEGTVHINECILLMQHIKRLDCYKNNLLEYN